VPLDVGGELPDDVVMPTKAVGVLERNLCLADSAHAVWNVELARLAPSTKAAHSSVVKMSDFFGVLLGLEETVMCAIWSLW
jgi:hypothetical protein